MEGDYELAVKLWGSIGAEHLFCMGEDQVRSLALHGLLRIAKSNLQAWIQEKLLSTIRCEPPPN